MKLKRLIIATMLGVLSGVICFGMASSGEYEVPLFLAVNIILGRTLIGFGIGISRFTLRHWALHGITMGFLFSIPAAFGAMLGPEMPEFDHTMIFVSTLVMGIIYGFFIEFFTSVIFRARQ